MEKIKQILKCFFGKHEWLEHSSKCDSELTRTCIYCKKIQYCYCGDWYNCK